MPSTIRAALGSYNAKTDNNPDHFSLYGDDDYVLIKEKMHGYKNILPSSYFDIAHNLGYIPMVFVYGREAPNTWTLILGDSGDAAGHISLSTTNLRIYNGRGDRSVAFVYYIFYDQIV